MANWTMSYAGMSKAEINSYKEIRWNHFIAAFEEVIELKVKYDKNIEDLCYIIKICPIEHTTFFVETFVRRVVCFLGRCRLLSDGKCLRKHQLACENDHLISSEIGLHGSFNEREQDTESTIRLTMRSHAAMNYLNVLTNSVMNLEWNTKEMAITDMVNGAYTNFEADLYNVLHDKHGIQKSSLVLKLKKECRVVIRFTAPCLKEYSEVLGVDPNVWKLGDDKRIFQNLQPAVMQNILKGLINSPVGLLDGKIFNVGLELNKNASSTSPSSSQETKDCSVTNKSTTNLIDTVNRQLGLGSRVAAIQHKSKSNSSISAVLSDNSPQNFRIESRSTFTGNEEGSGGLLSDQSTLDDKDVDDDSVVGVSLSKSKRKFLSSSNNKAYSASNIDIFDENSAWYSMSSDNDIDVVDSSYKRHRSTSKKPSLNAAVAASTEVANKSSAAGRKKSNHQEILVKSVARRSLKNEQRQATSKAIYEVQLYKRQAATKVDFMVDIVSELGDCKISEAVAALSLKSYSARTNCASSSSLALSTASTQPTTYPEINSKEVRDSLNKELDDKFVTILIRHTTNAVAAEIALERFLIEYIMRKELLNGVSYDEQQLITNWKDIFLCIEDLILRRIVTETRNDEDKLTNAYNLSTKENSDEMRQNMLLLDEKQSGMSDEDFFAESKAIREKSDAVHFGLTTHYKHVVKLNSNTQQSLTGKVMRTLHNIAEKIVYLWSKFNGCLNELLPEQLHEFSKKFAQRDTLEKALMCAESSQRLSLPEMLSPLRESSPSKSDTSAELFMCDQSSIVENNQSSFLVTEPQSHNVSILKEMNHSEKLEEVIRSIKVNPEQMKDFAKVLWTKASRSLFVKAVTVSNSKMPTPSKVTLTEKDNVLGTEEESLSTLPPSSEKSRAIFAEYFQLGGSSASSKSSSSASSLPTTSGSVASMIPFPAEEVTNLALKTYDDAMRMILHSVHACSDKVMLNLNYVSKKMDQGQMTSRMKLLQFLLANRHRDAKEVMDEFSRTELYSIFKCDLYFLSPLASGGTIRGDGYCFFRSIFQLYCREQSGYTMSTEAMTADDKLRNLIPADGVHVAEQFYNFVSDLKQHSKSVTPYLISVYGELQVFKFFEDMKLLKILLKAKPGCGLPKELWGNQLFVALLRFNVTGWTFVDSSARKKELKNKVPASLMEQKWVKYYNTSLSTQKMVEDRNYLTLPVLDELCTVTPNFLCFDGSAHFFVIDSPTNTEFSQCVSEAKRLAMNRLLQSVKIIEDGDCVLDVVDNIVVSLETNAPISVDRFNIEKFEQAFSVEFPFSSKTDDGVVDLVDDDPELTPKERMLTEKVKLLEGKEEIMKNHNTILVRTFVMADQDNNIN